MTHDIPWKSVWITGASSGIGRELAVRLARGGARVAVTARNGAELDKLAAANPGITAYPGDVTQLAELKAIAARIEAAQGPIDLSILNAGVWEPLGAEGFSAEMARHSMSVNHGGVVNGLEAIMPAMMARGAGQIALVASVAGYTGLPRAAAYGPTKAAVINLAEALHPELALKGVRLSVVNPGFVDTPMTRVNTFAMPFMISAEDAVGRILRGLQRGQFEIVFPWQMAFLMKLARRAPYPLYFWIAKRFMVMSDKPMV